jgi:hypothetical protein
MAPPKPVLITAFYDQLLSFMKELSAMYPDDPDFPLGIAGARLMKTTSPKFLISQFYENSKKFEDQILTKNEKFFLDHSFQEFSGDDSFDFNILAKLKGYVGTMSPSSKEAVWAYVQNLFKLVQAYHS